MSHVKSTLIKTVLVILGLAPVLQAQDPTPPGGPYFCPPLDQFLNPTLLDILLNPGATYR